MAASAMSNFRIGIALNRRSRPAASYRLLRAKF
jgi:hypothetical protein